MQLQPPNTKPSEIEEILQQCAKIARELREELRQTESSPSVGARPAIEQFLGVIIFAGLSGSTPTPSGAKRPGVTLAERVKRADEALSRLEDLKAPSVPLPTLKRLRGFVSQINLGTT